MTHKQKFQYVLYEHIGIELNIWYVKTGIYVYSNQYVGDTRYHRHSIVRMHGRKEGMMDKLVQR